MRLMQLSLAITQFTFTILLFCGKLVIIVVIFGVNPEEFHVATVSSVGFSLFCISCVRMCKLLRTIWERFIKRARRANEAATCI